MSNNVVVPIDVIRRTVTSALETYNKPLPYIGAAKPAFIKCPYEDGYGDLLPVFLPFKPTVYESGVLKEGGLHPIWAPGAQRRPHGLLGLGRAMAEYQIIELATRIGDIMERPIVIREVGANAERFIAAVRALGAYDKISKTHFMVPTLQPGDYARQINARARYDHCEHTYEECDCLIDEDVVVMQHSLYYFTGAMLIKKLHYNQQILASVHHVDDAIGNLYNGQLTWYVNDEEMAVCQAVGNNYKYSHRLTTWLNTGRCTDGLDTLSWDKVGHHFGSFVYRFRKTKGTFRELPDFDPGLSMTLVKTFNGMVSNVLKDKAVGFDQMEGADFINVSVYKITHILTNPRIYCTGNKIILLPKQILGVLTHAVTGLPRNAMTFKTLLEIARKVLGAGSYPPDLQSRAVLYSVVLAMVRDVESETTVISNMNLSHAKVFRDHSNVLGGGTIAKWGWLDYFGLLNPWNCSNMIKVKCYGEDHENDDAAQFQQIVSRGYLPIVHRPVNLDNRDLRANMDFKTKDVSKLNPTLKVKIGATLPKDCVPPATRLSLIALGSVPIAGAATSANYLQGLRARLGRLVPEADPESWKTLNSYLDDPTHPLNSLMHVSKLIDSDVVFSDWLLKFPANQRKKFVNGRQLVKDRGFVTADFVGSGLIKVEKSAMLGQFPPVFDPRLYISYKPTYQSITGPVLWTFAKAVRKLFDVGDPDAPLVWTNGPNATAENYGRWLDTRTRAVRGMALIIYYYVWDQVKFEAHRDKHAHEYFCRILAEYCNEPLFLECLKVEFEKVYNTKFDIQFIVDFILGSGKTSTSFDSFLRNLVFCYFVFPGLRTGTEAASINGDDGLGMSSIQYDASYFMEKALLLGFEIEIYVTTNLADVEFCQTVPWQTDNGTIWGPKIGRVLSRLPWSIEPSESDPRGVAKGMMVSCSHVPFLRVYLKRISDLAPNVDEVDYKYHIRSTEEHEADDSTFAFLFQRYGLTRNDEVLFEQFLSNIHGLKLATHWPMLQRLVDIDDAH
jgi:hypothetical protein